MSFHCSPGSEESTSASNGPDTESSANVKPTPQPDESSNGTGPEFHSPTTSEPLTLTGCEATAWDSLNHTESELVPTLGQNTGMATGRAGVIAFFDPSRTLMPDGSIMENWKKQEVANALTKSSGGGTKAPAILTSSAEDSPAKTSPSPANEQGSTANAPVSSSKQPESLTLFSDPEDGCSLRMFPDFFPQTVEGISESFSRRWPTSGFTTSPGECWTADTSECPSDGGEFSSLPDVLEATVPERFFLSPKAAAGIMRRAGKRGKELPEHLDRALRALSEEETGATNLTNTERMSREAA